MGVHHGLSQLLGGRTGIAHGLANAILLTHALRFNAEAASVELSEAAQVQLDAPILSGDRIAAEVAKLP